MRTIVDHAAVMAKANALMSELVLALEFLEWSTLEPPLNEDSAMCFQGAGDGWIVTVVAWKLHGANGWGYDGTCARDGMIVRLTLDVAEEVFIHAKTFVREERMGGDDDGR